jgi:hypothetical protein
MIENLQNDFIFEFFLNLIIFGWNLAPQKKTKTSSNYMVSN